MKNTIFLSITLIASYSLYSGDNLHHSPDSSPGEISPATSPSSGHRSASLSPGEILNIDFPHLTSSESEPDDALIEQALPAVPPFPLLQLIPSARHRWCWAIRAIIKQNKNTP